MKRYSISIIAALLILLHLTACTKQSISTGNEDHQTDITLIPLSSEECAFSTVVPLGWFETKPCHFLRAPRTDPTILAMATYPGKTKQQVQDFMGWELQQVNHRVDTSRFTWDIYTANIEWPDIEILRFNLALAEDSTGAYVLFFISLADGDEELFNSVFLPAVKEFTPMIVSEDSQLTPSRTFNIVNPQPLDTLTRDTDGMVMVYVPAGEFEMGNNNIQWIWDGRLSSGYINLQVFIDESPQHTVYLDAFWFDQTEVTVEMFRSFVEATGYETTAEEVGWGSPWTDGPMEEEWPHVPGTDWQHPHGPESFAQGNHPVVQVTWLDAAAYCEWAGGSLPTEAQWERAARGDEGWIWPWGNNYNGFVGNFCDAQCPVDRWNDASYEDGYALTAPVGSFPGGASPYGALDMAGNVWEWVADWYDEDYYENSPTENPLGPSFGVARTQRGGAWIDNESWVRTTVRHATPPRNLADDLGFRCAVPIEP